MSEGDPGLEAFSKFIVALEPWLGEVVLVGGWAHRLYRLDSRARKLDYLPLTTLDGDVAVPPKLKKEESTVRKRLLEAGSICAATDSRNTTSSFSVSDGQGTSLEGRRQCWR